MTMSTSPGLSCLFFSYFLQVVTDAFQIYRLGYQDFIQRLRSEYSKELLTLAYWHQNASLVTLASVGNVNLLLLVAFALLLCLVAYRRTGVTVKLLLPVGLSSISCLLTLTGDILRFHGYSLGTPLQRALVLFTLLQTFAGEAWYIFVFSIYCERETLSSCLMKLLCFNGVGIVSGICYLGVLPTYFFPYHAGLFQPMITVFINILNIVLFVFTYVEFQRDKCLPKEKCSQYFKSGDYMACFFTDQDPQDETLVQWTQRDSFKHKKRCHRDHRTRTFFSLYFILEAYSTGVSGIRHGGNFFSIVASVLNMNIAGNFSVLLCSLLFSVLADMKDFRKPSVKAFLATAFVFESIMLLLSYQCFSSTSSDVVMVCLRFGSLVSRNFLFIHFISGCIPTGRVLCIGWLMICKVLVSALTIGFQNSNVLLLNDPLLKAVCSKKEY